MPEVAGLNLAVDSSTVKQATAELRALAPAATAAERAAERWGMTSREAGRSADDFSKRVQGTIRSLEFERQQLTRTAAEQAKYAALRRAGVSASSAEGQAIAASVAALQAQRAAVQGLAGATGVAGKAATIAAASFRGLAAALGPAVLVFLAIEQAVKAWNTALASGDLGEQAEQVGVNTDQLQAYRLAAAQAGIESDALDTAITKLAKSMGDAADGNKDAIARFDQLGVKLLDARGELRPVADVLPEVARGVLDIGSSSQRTATLMELFGRGGGKMATVLESLAKGNDAVIASARQENAITSPGAIAAWDAVADRMKVAELRWKTLVTEFGAEFALPGLNFLIGLLEGTKKELEQIQSLWRWIMGNMDAAKRASLASTAAGPAQADVKNLEERLAALRQNPTQFGFKASEKALTDQIAARQAALAAAQSLGNQAIFDFDESVARRGKLPVMEPPLGVTAGGTVGAGNPAAKKTGAGSDPYKSAMESSRDYIASKNAETAAIGMSADAAARLKHETELLNKASNDNKVLSAAQTESLKAQAAAMAEADAKFASAKFMDDFKTKSEEFIAAQQIEQETLFMSTEAAMAYRIEHEAINQARALGITLQAADIEKLREGAAAQAAAAAKTSQMTELANLGREAFEGFFSDLANGLRNGQSAWDAFGNAATSALNRIADTLIQMAAKKLFESAFSGGGGGGGGFLSGIFGSIQGWLTGGMANAGQPGSPYYGPVVPSAYGNAFAGGNVIPFARGGIVSRPTLFPMANGAGLMGEAGPEAVMPLRRGPGGRLGVEASGGGGGGAVVVNIHNYAEGSKATAKQSKGPGGEMQIDVIVEMVEGKMAGRMARGQGSLGRVIEGTYGVQRVGR